MEVISCCRTLFAKGLNAFFHAAIKRRDFKLGPAPIEGDWTIIARRSCDVSNTPRPRLVCLLTCVDVLQDSIISETGFEVKNYG